MRKGTHVSRETTYTEAEVQALLKKSHTDILQEVQQLISQISPPPAPVDPYPVGSIYISVDSTDPGTLFGGTWVQIEDTFLLAAGTTYTAGDTGGEATHTLIVNEIPSHSHIVSNYMSAVGWSGVSPSYSYLNNNNDGYVGSTDPLSKDTGGGQPHNNMPPYLAVYVWKRTA